MRLKEDEAAPDVLSRSLSEKREKVAYNCLWKLGARLRDERLLELGLKGWRRKKTNLPHAYYLASTIVDTLTILRGIRPSGELRKADKLINNSRHDNM